MGLAAHLLEDQFGDVVVAAPVGRPLGIGELVDVDAAQLGRERLGGGIDPATVSNQVAGAVLALDLGDLLRRGRGRHHGMEGQAEQAGEVGFRDRRRARRGLDDRRVLPDAAVADAVQEQRARQPVLEATRGMSRFVLEVDVDALRVPAGRAAAGVCRPSGAGRCGSAPARGATIRHRCDGRPPRRVAANASWFARARFPVLWSLSRR